MEKKIHEAFIEYIYEMVHIQQNAGFTAKMKKADNELTEVQSWEILARWTDLEKKERTKCFALIGAAVARSKCKTNGELGLGRGLWLCLEDQAEIEKSSAAARLRRILACQDSTELIRVLRSTLRYLESKDIVLDYARLLKELLWYDYDEARDRFRARWTKEFFGQREEK